MRRTALALAALIGWQALPAPPGALGQTSEETPENECCLVLLIPVGARSVALGGTLASRAAADAVFRNPAGLASLTGDAFFVHHSEQEFASTSDAFSLLLTPGDVGAVGLSYQLFDHGEIETRDPNNQATGLLVLRDHLLVVSFATELLAGLSAGVNYKLFHNRIDCSGACLGLEVASTTHGMDAGVRYQPIWLDALELGASVMNAGLPLRRVEEEASEPMPTRVHVGAAYEVLRQLQAVDALALWLSVEVTDEWRDPGSPTTAFGAELGVGDMVFLRAGYVPGEGLGTGGAVGLGLQYESLTLALGKPFETTLTPEEEPFQVTFGFVF